MKEYTKPEAEIIELLIEDTLMDGAISSSAGVDDDDGFE